MARTTRPASVTVAMPMAASSNTSRKRSRCSRRTVSVRSVGTAVSSSPVRRARRTPRCRPVEHGEQLVGESVERGGLLQERRGAELAAPVREALLWKPLYIATLVPGEASRTPGSASKPVHDRHRHVQQQQRGRLHPHGLDRLDAVRGLADDVQLARQP